VGGIRTFVRYVYRKFDPKKYKLHILAPDGPELRIMLDDLETHDVTYIPCSKEPTPWIFFWDVQKTILGGSYDLVHAHGITSGVLSALICRLKGVPLLLTTHDTFNDKQFVGLRGILNQIALNIILSLVNVINTVSYDARDNLLTYMPLVKILKKKVVVIPNGIEVERFIDAHARDFRAELGLPSDTFLVGFLGRFMSPKGFVYLVDALQELYRDDHLPQKPHVLTFNPESGFVREERSEIERKGLEGVFHFLPFTPNVAEVLKGLDVVVMPSLSEACGMLAMEALVAGVPIIGTNCIGLREVLANTPAIVVNAGDSHALAVALRKEMKERTTEVFRLFQNEAMKRFNVIQQAADLERLIIKIGLKSKRWKQIKKQHR